MHKIEILFLSSVPDNKNYLEVHRECTTIEDGIKSGKYEAMFNLPLKREWSVNVNNLTQVLLKFNSLADVIHFSGHGLKTGIFIDGEKGNAKFVSADLFSNTLQNTKVKARLVVLNTCHSDEHAQTIADIVGCTIGAQDSLPDELAIEFSRSFYRNLSYDFSIREAFDLALTDLRLLGHDKSKYPRLFHREGLDPSDVYLISRIGRKLIHDIKAWNGFVLLLVFAKQIHHMFQTISVMHDLFPKLAALGELSNCGDIVRKNETQNNFQKAWTLYQKDYDSLKEELNSLSPNYKQAVFNALDTLNDANVGNPNMVSLVKKCRESTVAIIGNSTTRGGFDNYVHNHAKVLTYMNSTLTRELSASESILASVQDMKQFSSDLTVSADTLIKQIISILLDSGE